MRTFIAGFKLLPKNEQKFWMLIYSEALTIPVGMALLLLGLDVAAIMLLPAVLLGWVAYVVFVDSRSRWPGVGRATRWAYVLTFKR